MAVPSASTTTATASAAARKASKAAASKVAAPVKQTDGTAPTSEVASAPSRKLVPDPALAPTPAAPSASLVPSTVSLARNPSLPLVTVAEIQAAVQIVSASHSGKQRMVYLAGRSAASLDELKSVVRSLAKVGRLHPEALTMLADADADDARALLETADGASASVGGAVRDAMRESILADFEHSVDVADVADVADGGGDNATMVRDVYRGPWRSPEEVTGAAAETAAEVNQAMSEAEDVLDAADTDNTDNTSNTDAADKVAGNTETTPLGIALDIANNGSNGNIANNGNAEKAEQNAQE